MHPNPRIQARLIGLLLMIIGSAGDAYVWHSVLTHGKFSQTVSIFAPFAAFAGLSMIFYPMTKAESLERYGTEQIPWKHIPAPQKIMVVGGLVLGLLQWAAFKGFLPL